MTDLVIDAVGLGLMTYEKEVVTQVGVRSSEQIRRGTRLGLVLSFP